LLDDANSFAISLNKFGDLTVERTLLVKKGLAAQALRGIVVKTPVDTGRARSNTMVGIGSVNYVTVEDEDPSGESSIARGLEMIGQAVLGASIWITNSLPYFRRLEYGWSKQAPQGMVRVTALEIGGEDAAAIAVAKALQGIYR
jgi:hypothetical protein